MTKSPRYETLTLEKIVGGGQALGTLNDGRKCFVWGGLPGETVVVRITKKKSHYLEGIVTEVKVASNERIKPKDPASYLSTSPWQIMTFAAEQNYKAALIEEAFELHDIVLPDPIEIFTDGHEFHYRNKVEFSWYSESAPTPQTKYLNAGDTLDLAFFRRGSKGKVVVEDSALLPENIVVLARQTRDFLYAKNITARQLKTLLIRSNQSGETVWQLYVKDQALGEIISNDEAANFAAKGGEIIFSDPQSPASRITKRLAKFGDSSLTDTILGVPFRYATEGFFQVNIPVYEQALRDMKQWVNNPKVLDLYSGVGTIGLTIGGQAPTLIEINADAAREMKRNIAALNSRATAVLAPSEKALDYIDSDSLVIVDPPRAGLHKDVVAKLLENAPPRIIYLSCNPATQARDVALLAEKYGIRYHRGYNFFPRTPHIEHVVVLLRKDA